MSSVYRAHDRQLERNVALKVLHERLGADDEHVSRFRHEARAVAQLSHPNVVTVIDRFEEGGRQYIVFEYVDGENLKQLLDRTGPLPAAPRARDRGRGGGRPRVRARARRRAPRREAAERPAQPRRRDQGDRLRDRAVARRRERADADGNRARHEQLPLSGAGERPARHAGGRRLLPRRRALRAAGGRGAVPRREPGRRRAEARQRAAAEPAGAAARRSGAPRGRGGAGAAEGPGAAVRLDGRLRGGAARLPRRGRVGRHGADDGRSAAAAPAPGAAAARDARRPEAAAGGCRCSRRCSVSQSSRPSSSPSC